MYKEWRGGGEEGGGEISDSRIKVIKSRQHPLERIKFPQSQSQPLILQSHHHQVPFTFDQTRHRFLIPKRLPLLFPIRQTIHLKILVAVIPSPYHSIT